jgi:hypothetical protein
MNNNILQQRLIDSLRKHVQILGHILPALSQAQTREWRDGGGGWTVLEVVCHLRDYDDIFRERGELMLAEEHPTFPVYDHLAMVVERAYNEQDLTAVYQTLQHSRTQFIQFFENLDEAQWLRTGQHVDHGRYTLESLAAHVAWHDANHLEQITRIIRNEK